MRDEKARERERERDRREQNKAIIKNFLANQIMHESMQINYIPRTITALGSISDLEQSTYQFDLKCSLFLTQNLN